MLDEMDDNVYEIGRQKDVIARIAFKMKNRHVIATFNTWIDYLEDRKYNRELVRKVLFNLKHSTLRSGFRKWRDIYYFF
jgi:hypothetical protein